MEINKALRFLENKDISQFEKYCVNDSIVVVKSSKGNFKLRFPWVGIQTEGVIFDLDNVLKRYYLRISKESDFKETIKNDKKYFTIKTEMLNNKFSLVIFLLKYKDEYKIFGLTETDNAYVKIQKIPTEPKPPKN